MSLRFTHGGTDRCLHFILPHREKCLHAGRIMNLQSVVNWYLLRFLVMDSFGQKTHSATVLAHDGSLPWRANWKVTCWFILQKLGYAIEVSHCLMVESVTLWHSIGRKSASKEWKYIASKKHDIERTSAGQVEYQTSKIRFFFFSKFPKMILRWCCAMVFGLLFSAGAYFLELRQGTPLISLQGSEAWTPATAAMTSPPSPPSPPSPASPASPVAMDADATDAVKMSWRYATRTELLEVMFASQFDSEVGNCSFEFKHACLGRPRVAKVPALKSGFLGATRISTKEGHSDQHALKPLDRLLRHVARRPPCIFTFVATRELIKLSFCSP